MKYLKSLGYIFILPIFYWASLQTILDSINLINLKYSRLTAVGNAVMLDISVSSPADFAPPIIPGSKAERSFAVNKNNDIPFTYKVSALNAAGSLCPYLKLTADINDAKSAYAGQVSTFTLDAKPGNKQDNWRLYAVLTSDDPGLQDSICLFDIAFSGQDLVTGESDKQIAVIHNVVKSGQWVDEYDAKPGDVVINELMRFGSTASLDDEWIELKNLTAKTLDISDWKLKNLHGTDKDYALPTSTYLDPSSYFLIAKSAAGSINTALAVKPDINDPLMILPDKYGPQIILEDSTGTVIDRAAANFTYSTASQEKHSLERNAKPGSGLRKSDWHLCNSEFTDSDIFWTIPGKNFGTPGAANSAFEAPITYHKETYDIDVPARRPSEPQILPDQPAVKPVASPEQADDNLIQIETYPFPIMEPVPQTR